jgi:hypothetical protein
VAVDSESGCDSGDTAEPGEGWAKIDGTFAGVAGRCALMCQPRERRAQWLFRTAADGWRGEAACTLGEGLGMTIRATEPDREIGVDRAVGALWRSPAGARTRDILSAPPPLSPGAL